MSYSRAAVLSGTIAILLVAACGTTSPERPSIRSNEPSISYRIGDELHRSAWRLDPELQPDILVVDLEEGQALEACLLTDVEEFCRDTTIGQSHDVDVLYDGVAHHNRIEGRKRVPAAVFPADYRTAYSGMIVPVIPEVYELVNVAIALTPFAREDRWLVYKDTEYYARVMVHFADWLDHPFVLALDQELRANRNRYARLKMNGYAFVYDEGGEVVRSPIYDRTGFAGERENVLLPFLGDMRAFSRDTRFRDFYASEQSTFDEQVRFYVEDIDLGAMNAWLGRHFPDVAPYDSVKIVFSPLVGGSQSVTWFEDGGFRELQPHINFPYRTLDGISHAGNTIYRGNIAFTELNHGYINPTTDGHADRVAEALIDRSFWVDEQKVGSYSFPVGVFGEYMNWGLVALYYLDHAPATDHDTLMARLDRFMGSEGRGFLQFPAFREFLVDAYANRAAGETIADLYPAIIPWFATHEAAAR